MIDDAEFARRIRAARAYLGLNLEEAGSKMGLSPHRLSRRERADVNGMRMTVADRFHITAVYVGLLGWPPEFFTDEELPPIPLPPRRPGPEGEDEDALDPAEVVRLVEDVRDENGEVVERP
jgi:transcriptional regulator with XRE-family HTH domain